MKGIPFRRFVTSLADDLAGRPRIGLAPTRILVAEVVVPYRQGLDPQSVEERWQALAGGRPMPAWFSLGSLDTPSGTRWRVAFCPIESSEASLDPDRDVVLPEGLWVFWLQARSGGDSAGWRRLETREGDRRWIGVWDGERCERLQAVAPEGLLAADREEAWCRAHWPESLHGAPLAAAWVPPTVAELRELHDAFPESDLFSAAESLRRERGRRRRQAMVLASATCALLFAVSATLAIAEAGARWRIARENERLALARPQIDRLQRLGAARVDSLRKLSAASAQLARNSRVDLLLKSLVERLPEQAVLGPVVLDAASAPDGADWKITTEMRIPTWDLVRPAVESLQLASGVRAVRIDQQTRRDGQVSTILDIVGRWP